MNQEIVHKEIKNYPDTVARYIETACGRFIDIMGESNWSTRWNKVTCKNCLRKKRRENG